MVWRAEKGDVLGWTLSTSMSTVLQFHRRHDHREQSAIISRARPLLRQVSNTSDVIGIGSYMLAVVLDLIQLTVSDLIRLTVSDLIRLIVSDLI